MKKNSKNHSKKSKSGSHKKNSSSTKKSVHRDSNHSATDYRLEGRNQGTPHLLQDQTVDFHRPPDIVDLVDNSNILHSPTPHPLLAAQAEDNETLRSLPNLEPIPADQYRGMATIAAQSPVYPEDISEFSDNSVTEPTIASRLKKDQDFLDGRRRWADVVRNSPSPPRHRELPNLAQVAVATQPLPKIARRSCPPKDSRHDPEPLPAEVEEEQSQITDASLMNSRIDLDIAAAAHTFVDKKKKPKKKPKKEKRKKPTKSTKKSKSHNKSYKKSSSSNKKKRSRKNSYGDSSPPDSSESESSNSSSDESSSSSNGYSDSDASRSISDDSDSDSDSDDKNSSEPTVLDFDYSKRKKRGSSKNHKSRKYKKRDSIVMNTSEIGSNQKTKILLTQTPPDYSYITITNLSLKNVNRFIKDANIYQLKYGISIPLAVLVGDKIREHLVATSRGKISEAGFFRLRNRQIIKLLVKAIRPRSKMEFRLVLNKGTSFELPGGYRPSASDFKPFYDAYLFYNKQFLHVYEVCAHNNADNIPPLNNKEGGLIKEFLDKIPYGYGKKLYESFADHKFETIYDFLSKMNKQIQKHYRSAMATRLVNQHFAGTQFEIPTAAATRSDPSKTKHKLHNVQHLSSALDFFEDDDAHQLQCYECSDPLQPDAPSSADSDSELEGEVIQDNLIEPFDYPDEDPFPPSHQLAAFQPSKILQRPATTDPHVKPKQPVTGPLACFNMLLSGKCERKNCSYSHDSKILTAKWVEVNEKIMNSKYRLKNH